MKTSIAALSLSLLALFPLAAEPIAVGDEAPDFTLTNLNGASVTLSEANKDSKVALIFLRGWNGYQCPLCSRQTAAYLKEAEAFAERGYQLIFLYPNHGEAEATNEKANEFAAKYEFPEHFHFVTDPGVETGKAYGLLWDAPRETVYPAFLLLDESGVVTYADVSSGHGGRVSAKDAIKAMDGLQ